MSRKYCDAKRILFEFNNLFSSKKCLWQRTILKRFAYRYFKQRFSSFIEIVQCIYSLHVKSFDSLIVPWCRFKLALLFFFARPIRFLLPIISFPIYFPIADLPGDPFRDVKNAMVRRLSGNREYSD